MNWSHKVVCFIVCNRVRTRLHKWLADGCAAGGRADCLEKQLKNFIHFEGSKIIMIMPANYSVIAENELSYVEGGAFNFYVDPIQDGGKVLAKNIVEYIGNAYTASVLNAFIGTWFIDDGSESIAKKLKANVGDMFTRNVKAQGTTAGKALMGLTNTIGVAAGIYLLGKNDDVVKATTLTTNVLSK
jgi:hypothetical protein